MKNVLWVLLLVVGNALCDGFPDIPAQDHEGKRIRLQQLTKGRVVALQFVFTDCPTACPLLGALFQGVQKRLADLSVETGPLLLTVSVNPQRDTPTRLAAWRNKFSGGPRWHAIRLSTEDLRALQGKLGQQGGPPSAHTTDFFLFDKSGKLIRRLDGLPSANQVAQAIRDLE
ncbi:MAG: SCO family protein [Acidobacteriota bacterium]|jgi:protein SCO1/2